MMKHGNFFRQRRNDSGELVRSLTSTVVLVVSFTVLMIMLGVAGNAIYNKSQALVAAISDELPLSLNEKKGDKSSPEQSKIGEIVHEVEYLKTQAGGLKSEVDISQDNLPDGNNSVLTIAYNNTTTTINSMIPNVAFTALSKPDSSYIIYAKTISKDNQTVIASYDSATGKYSQ